LDGGRIDHLDCTIKTGGFIVAEKSIATEYNTADARAQFRFGFSASVLGPVRTMAMMARQGGNH
jgi:hypothetical protein